MACGSARPPGTACGVPYLTPGARVNLGPSGSLIQARGWLWTARISHRPAAQRDWRLHAAAALTAAAVALLALGVGLLSAAIATGQLVGWLLGLLMVLGGIVAVVAVQVRYRQGPVAAELSTQIRREQHLARELDLLRPLGWTVLHDRLAPGTEHRMAHVLAGPGGLVVATVLPVAEPLRRYGRQLYTGQVPLQQWFTTRAAARSGPLSRRCRRRWAGSRPPSSAPRSRRPAHPPECRTACSPAADPTSGGRHRHNQLRATTDSIRTALPSAPEGHRRPALPAAVAGRSRRSGRTRWPGTAPAIPRRSARPVCRHRRGPVPAGGGGQVLGLAAGPQVVQSGAAGLTGLARVAAAECLRHAAPEDGG